MPRRPAEGDGLRRRSPRGRTGCCPAPGLGPTMGNLGLPFARLAAAYTGELSAPSRFHPGGFTRAVLPRRPLPGPLLGRPWAAPGPLLGLSWTSLGPLLDLSWASPWSHLGLTWVSPGASGGHTGALA